MVKIGTKVQTPHGSGVVVQEEIFRTCERWGVKLDANPFSFPVSFYLKSEVTATPPKPKGCESELYPHNCHIGGCLYCIRFNTFKASL